MSRGKNKKRNVIIVFASVIILLLAGTLLLLFLPTGQAPGGGDEGGASGVTVESNFHYLFEPGGNIASVTFLPQTGQAFTIRPVYEYGNFILEADDLVFSGRQDVMDSMASAARPLTRLQRVTDNADDTQLKMFGFDNPLLEWQLIYDDGRLVHLLLGSELPTGEGYYVRAADSREIFIILRETGDYLLTALEDTYDISFLPLPPSTNDEQTWVYIFGARLARPGGDVIDIYKRDFITMDNVTLSTTSFYLTEPFNADCNDYAVETVFMEPITCIQPASIVEIHPADLSVYGLDDPAVLTVTLPISEDEGYVRTLMIGRHDAVLGGRYVMIEGHDAVLLDTIGSYEFLNASPQELRNRHIWLHMIGDVASVEFNLDGVYYELVFEHFGGDGVDGNDSAGLKGYLNGAEISEADAKRYYMAALAVMASGSTDEPIPAGVSPMHSITISFTGGGSETLELYPINDTQFLISHEGESTSAYITRLELRRNLLDLFG